MTREEMKKKIYEMVLAELQNQFGCGDTVEVGDREVCADAAANALIEAGVVFVEGPRKGWTEADHYWCMWQGALEELERAEHRAKVAERAFDLMLKREKNLRCIHSFTNCGKNCEECWNEYFSKQKQGYLKQAEKELAEERKDEQKKRGRNDNADKGGVSVHVQERNAGRA